MIGTLKRVRARLRPQSAGVRLVRAFARDHPRATFVEIGANDGLRGAYLRKWILTREWRGVMVEPVPYVFERLRRNYGDLARVAVENVAIDAADGSRPFFYLREPDPEERAELPGWYDEIGSFDRDHLLHHASLIPDLEARIVRAEVPTVSLATLCDRHGIGAIDILVIDAEGHDAKLIAGIDFERFRPRVIGFEHHHLSHEAHDGTRLLLRDHGYELLGEGFNTWCLLPAPDRLTRRWRRLRPIAQPLTAAGPTD